VELPRFPVNVADLYASRWGPPVWTGAGRAGYP